MARTNSDDHASLSAAVVRRNGQHHLFSCCITELEASHSLPEASQEAVTAADVQMYVVYVGEIKRHPDVSEELLDAVRGEVATLMQGQRFSFDFD